MRKFFILLILSMLLSIPALSGAELRFADATGGAATGVFMQAAIELSLSRKLDVFMTRMLPGKALAAFDAGELDGVIIDRRFAGKRSFVPFAAEALALYVSNVNPGVSLTKAQVLQILLAERPNWLNYNRLDMDIQRIIMAPTAPSGTLIRRIFGNQNYAAEIFEVDSISAGFAFTNSASLFFGQFRPMPPVELKMLPVNGVIPDSASVLSGKYPLSLHYAVICRKNSPEVKLLLQTVNQNKYRQHMQSSGLLVMLP